MTRGRCYFPLIESRFESRGEIYDVTVKKFYLTKVLFKTTLGFSIGGLNRGENSIGDRREDP